ncbi:hypothetical protein [Tunicatimonas pelagia]|uniref:hypothetical protein n=1 Tax=Tunicatimonas pelagia TaxID=931531 RepID=UPI0026667723|nr:hypothetical protein [Tunicatimonas pelagia]WKN44601.1 hypothetical protein P0M28_06445 [Tunicatimonas pelagia]
MIDTLTIARQLQESGLPQQQAEAIAIQMGEIVKGELATQENLKKTELALQKEIEEVRLSLQKEIEEVRLSLQKEIREVELRLSDKMNVQLRWILGFIVGQAAITVTILRFLT